MSLLWSGIEKKQLTISKKPSPNNQSSQADPAQNPNFVPNGGGHCPPNMPRFMEGTSLPASHLDKKLSFGNRGSVFLRKADGGMTVEASILLPLVLFVFLNLGCAIEMIRLHGNLQLALWQIGREASLYGYVLDSGEVPEDGQQEEAWWKELGGIMFASTFVKGRLIDLAGRAYLDGSPLTKGADGLGLWESNIFGPDDIVDIVVTYSVSPWSSMAGFPSFRMANRYYAHVWNGYRLPDGAEETREQIVYVTANASVYHLYRDCTHLWISVRAIPAEQVPEMRNQYGQRYRPCGKCGKGVKGALLYVTDEGDCYHYDRECSGLKRTVCTVKLEEAGNLPLCSRCRQRVP